MDKKLGGTCSGDDFDDISLGQGESENLVSMGSYQDHPM